MANKVTMILHQFSAFSVAHFYALIRLTFYLLKLSHYLYVVIQTAHKNCG